MQNISLILFLSISFIGCKPNAVSKIDSSKENKPIQVNLDYVDTPTDAKMVFESLVWDFGEIN